MTQGNAISNDPLTIMVNSFSCGEEQICVRAGIFFRSLIAGCNCADDPSTPDTIEEYAEMEFLIRLDDALTRVRITE